ncbi:non-hydrolyzing UDP-N-acetylglucosamine 2-epimerase [Anaerostipes caccae]|uniref:non-hydrolyzing UDP-N-acetylglucosamine 2-epimerase n=1 Tax=Anaerostipes caccae TaxID=105841 RepID=UPI0038D46DDB
MIMHVVGNRPQLIKLAPLSRELHNRGYEDIIIHTGQHYDENMSDIFFNELGIEKPYKNLRIGSGSHAQMTGMALIELEKLMNDISPSAVVVYGDTNSTLAAALAAVKLDIPIVHIEAGPRTYAKNNPEEINRTLVDHISKILCCPDRDSVENLKKENITEGVFFTGDIMHDTFLYCKKKGNKEILEKYNVDKEEYVLMTWHRQENTNSKERMNKILDFIVRINDQVLCPLHPRTKKMLEIFGLWEKALKIENLKIVEPIGYMDMVALMNDCKYVLCDSGGVSKETYFAKKKCLFMLKFNPWKELVNREHIITIDFDDSRDRSDKIKIANAIKGTEDCNKGDLFGDGTTSEQVVEILKTYKLI